MQMAVWFSGSALVSR